MRNFFLFTYIILLSAAFLAAAETTNKKPIILGNGNRLVGAYHPDKGWMTQRRAEKLITPKRELFYFSISDGIGHTVRGELVEPDIDGGVIFKITDYVEDDNLEKEPSYWDPYPRKERKISTNHKTYQKIAAERLNKKGLSISEARLTSGYRIDLNGDGKDEVVLTGATRDKVYAAHSPHQAGDYSFVIFRCINKKGKVETQDVELDAFPNPPDKKYGPLHNIAEHEVTEFIDINGDGVMEVILSIVAWEAWGVSIWEFSEDRLVRVLSSGWGH